MRGRAIALALVGGVPAAMVSFLLLVRSTREFFDPCHQWGVGAVSSSGTGKIYPGSAVLQAGGHGPCAQRLSGTPETRNEALARLMLVNGGILVGSALGILGVIRSLAWVSVCGAVVMLLESLVAFSIFPLTVLAGALFLLAARSVRRTGGELP